MDKPRENTSVALVGPALQENLALMYLAAAVEREGFRAPLVRFNDLDDLDSCVRHIVSTNPTMVGLGIPFQYCIDDYLLLARKIRVTGYVGHITCGGHVPTFNYRDLLRDAPAVDTVVRHEGEQTLVELMLALHEDRPLAGIKGLVWRSDQELVREPHRPLVRDLDTYATPKREPEKRRLCGIPLACILTSRGCGGDCAYCCIRAFAKDAGGPRHRMRSPEAVAQEMSELHYQRGVKAFMIQDDLFILTRPEQAIQRMNALGDGLRNHGVNEIALWVKGRPDSITPEVLDAAARLGVIHLFLGIESASESRLRYFGRTHTHADSIRALHLCKEHGVRASFNLLLFDPDCTLDDVAAGLDFASGYLDQPWNFCRTEIYSGAHLENRLRQQGRLSGDYRSYGYTMTDKRAETAFRIMRVCYHERAFSLSGLLNRMISLSFGRQLHEKFFKGPNTEKLSAEVDQLLIDTYRDTCENAKRVLDYAASVDLGETEAIGDFAVDLALKMNQGDLERRKKCLDLLRRFSRTGMMYPLSKEETSL